MGVLKQKSLLFVVFTTGACVLILEVVAVRILSPYFGNTIYSYSSVLSVILAALSFGYYFGGKYADKYPSYKNFFGIIFLSGFTVLLMELLIVTFIPQFAYDLSFSTGPLIVSTILFALPSFLLGTLSPYAIKLQGIATPKEGLGSLSGEIFFASTVGSIVGSLLAGFVLIPYFGIQTIVLGTAILLLGLGGVGLLQNNSSKKKVYSIIILSILCGGVIQTATKTLSEGVVHAEDGVYERLVVYDTEIRERPSRLLLQDRSAASAIERETGKLVFEYAPYYQLYKVNNMAPKNALFIGAGAYTFPKVLMEELPDVRVDVVEIEPKLYKIAQQYFGLEETERLTNYTKDGRRFLHDTSKKYDYIYSDVYKTVHSIPVQFTTTEFFKLAKSKMEADGIILLNIIGNIKDDKESVVLSEIKTFREIFPNSYFFATISPDTKTTQNIVFLGINSEKKIDLSQTIIKDVITDKVISLEDQRIPIEDLDFSSHITFTDNFAPIERYSTKLLEMEYTKEETISGGRGMLDLIQRQVDFGPRYPGSEGHKKMVEWLGNELYSISKENTFKQEWKQKGIQGEYALTNFILRVNPTHSKRVVVGTHFDTLKRSSDTRTPIPGANNGASGTAVMLSLARQLQEYENKLSVGVDFVFFDAEEADPDISPGGIPNWVPWGSTYFVKNLNTYYPNEKPNHMINLDLVCSSDAQFYYEVNSLSSAESQAKRFWEIGARLDSKMFPKQGKYTIIDDHIAFQKAGIPAFLVIDFDYAHLHSTKDTGDKCSGKSLEKVKQTLMQYLLTM